MNIVELIDNVAIECGLTPKDGPSGHRKNSRLLRYLKGSDLFIFVYKRKDLILYVWKVAKPENRLVEKNLKVNLHEPDSLDRIREFLAQ